SLIFNNPILRRSFLCFILNFSKYRKITVYGYKVIADFIDIPLSMEKQNFNIIFGKFIKFKRTESGWSQSELAAKLGHNYQNVSRIERGEISPTFYWCFEVLATAFETKCSELIREFEDFKSNS